MWVGEDIQRHISSQEKEPYPIVIELSYCDRMTIRR